MPKHAEKRAARAAEKLEKQHSRERLARHAADPNIAKAVPKVVLHEDDNQNTVLWSFNKFDNHDWRGDPSSQHATFCEIAMRLREQSDRKWADILANKKRDHSCEITNLSADAQRRLRELQLDDIDELFRFRFDGTHRLWGVRDGAYFIVLWWDPDHQIWPYELPNT